MNTQGPIVIIEDDADDRYLIATVFKELNYPNKIEFFPDGVAALRYLHEDVIHPFLILSDMNMPKLDGLELRKVVYSDNSISQKCVPYLFFSTSVNKKSVMDAYSLYVQGFFLKPNDYDMLKHTLRVIVEYWKVCYSPGSYS